MQVGDPYIRHWPTYLSQDDVFHFRYETSNDIKQQKKTPKTYLSGRTINLNQQIIFKRTLDLRIQVHPRENFKNLKLTQVCVIQIFCSKRRRTIWQPCWCLHIQAQKNGYKPIPYICISDTIDAMLVSCYTERLRLQLRVANRCIPIVQFTPCDKLI